LNAANEVAVALFLAGEIQFDQIHAVNLATLSACLPEKPRSLEDLLEIDAKARIKANQAAKKMLQKH
jgi:1-deoxy-D-xylulose-5-phosphate reductoisomerase